MPRAASVMVHGALFTQSQHVRCVQTCRVDRVQARCRPAWRAADGHHRGVSVPLSPPGPPSAESVRWLQSTRRAHNRPH
jgi:hypothetical protein